MAWFAISRYSWERPSFGPSQTSARPRQDLSAVLSTTYSHRLSRTLVCVRSGTSARAASAVLSIAYSHRLSRTLVCVRSDCVNPTTTPFHRLSKTGSCHYVYAYSLGAASKGTQVDGRRLLGGSLQRHPGRAAWPFCVYSLGAASKGTQVEGACSLRQPPKAPESCCVATFALVSDSCRGYSASLRF